MKVQNTSTWSVDKGFNFPRLENNITSDVVVIGGGMAGVLCAYLLAKENQRVVLLESKRVLSGATKYTTAFLTQVIDTDFVDLVDMYGSKNTRRIWESHGQAIDLIERIVKEEGIECEFKRCSEYQYVYKKEDLKALKQEYIEMKNLGFNVSLKSDKELGFKNGGYIETKHQAKFHPLKFLEGVVSKLVEMGVQIHEKSEVLEIKGKSPVKVFSDLAYVRAKEALITTYHPFNNPKQTFAKKGMYVSHVFELEIPKGKFREGIYEDSENPYHYFRIDAGERADRMIVGGEDHRKELRFAHQKSFKALHAFVQKFLKGIKYTMARQWSGPILEPSDGLALIGRVQEGQLIATAFSGNGMTYSAISAMLLRDLVMKKKNPWEELYDPKRIPNLKQLYVKGRDYTEELIKGAVKNTIKY